MVSGKSNKICENTFTSLRILIERLEVDGHSTNKKMNWSAKAAVIRAVKVQHNRNSRS